MRNRVLRSLPVALAGLVLLTGAACGGGSESAPEGAKVDSPASAATAAGTSASSAKAPTTKAEATLRSVGGSAASGTATLSQAADKVEYHVEVSGASPGPHAMYLLQNATCAAGGNRTGPLNPVNATADGSGVADGNMTTLLGSLIGRSLALYAGDTGSSEIVACGQISAAQ